MSIISKFLNKFRGQKVVDDNLSIAKDNINISPVSKELTEEEFDSISDDKLLQIMFDNISQMLAIYDEDEYKSVMCLNKSRQAIYMIWCLESEVNNGGFDQFYQNSSGKFYKQLPEALRLVGAKNFATLMTSANNILKKVNKEILKQPKRKSERISMTDLDSPFDGIDEEFYNLYEKEDLEQIQINFVRKYKSDFIGS